MASKLEAKLGLSTEGFAKGAQEARSEIQKTEAKAVKSGKAMSAAFKGLGGMIAGAFTIGAAKEFINDLDALGKRAKDLGVSAAALKAMGEEAKDAGMEMSEFDDAMKTFAEKMGAAASGTGTEADALKKLGVSAKDANGTFKTTEQLLMDVADAFKADAAGAETAKVAADLFGGSSLKMARLLEQGSSALKSQAADFEVYNDASRSAAELNEALNNVTAALGKIGARSVKGFSQMIDMAKSAEFSITGLTFNFKKLHEIQLNRAVQRANKEALENIKKRERAQAEAAKKAQAAEIEYHDSILKSQKTVTDALNKNLSAQDKLKNVLLEISAIKKDMADLDEGTAEYAKEYNKLAQKTVERLQLEQSVKKEMDAERTKAVAKISAAEKKILDLEKQGWSTQKKLLEAEKEMADIQEQMSTASSLQEQADAQEKYADKLIEIAELQKEHDDEMQKRRDDAKKAEKELQDLYKERKGIFKEIADKAKEATESTLKLAGEKGGGKVGSKMRRAEDADKLAEEALADGRMNDYFKYSDRAKGLREGAAQDRKGMLEDKGARALEKGDMETYNRLKEEYSKEGFGAQNPKDDQAEVLKENLDNTTRLKELMEELVGGLKDG